MIFIKTKGDHLEGLSPEQQQAHVQKIGKYIGGQINLESNILKTIPIFRASPPYPVLRVDFMMLPQFS